MIRKILYLLVAAACIAAPVEFFARQRFPELADRRQFAELSFIRLLNSGVVYRPGSNYDERFGFLNNPHIRETVRTDEYRYTVATNSLGFRTHEITPKPPGQRRLMLLGDSMFFGVGVDYPATVPGLLETARDSLQVYNFAMLGHNTVQSRIAARAFADQVGPDHIVCGVFIGNDLLTNALNYPDENNHIATHLDQVAASRKRLAAALAPFTWSTALRVAAYSVYIPRLRYQWAAAPDIIAATCDHLAAIANTATTVGSTFATVLIYPKDAVAGGPVEIWSQSRRPGRRLAETCRTRNIEIIDLLDHIEGPTDRDRYYYAQDGHLNAAGNQLIANLIAKHYLPPPATTQR